MGKKWTIEEEKETGDERERNEQTRKRGQSVGRGRMTITQRDESCADKSPSRLFSSVPKTHTPVENINYASRKHVTMCTFILFLKV
jgi:hypothetical protein